MTHREFAIIGQENVERTHDENEREAMYAIMYAAASRGKGKRGKLPNVDDLYKRPSLDEISGKSKEESAEDLRAKHEHTMEWISQFDLSKFSEKDGDKDDNGGKGGR